MRRSTAAAGSAVFFAVAPAVVAGLVPWLLTGWRVGQPPYWLPLRLLGAVLVTAGAVFIVQAFVRFVVEGLGTPAPVAPPSKLVIGGIYRYIRNPMYVALFLAITGQALLLTSPGLFLYAAVVVATTFVFVQVYEQPTLHEQFGEEYDAYRRAVPGWWPRLRPWRPGERS